MIMVVKLHRLYLFHRPNIPVNHNDMRWLLCRDKKERTRKNDFFLKLCHLFFNSDEFIHFYPKFLIRFSVKLRRKGASVFPDE